MSQRLDRINELLRREISTVLQRDFEFGGALVTVSGVDITQDLREAKVFVGVLGGYGAKVIEQLTQRRALIQSRVAKASRATLHPQAGLSPRYICCTRC